MRYFVVVGGADEGPFTFEQLKELAARGDLDPESVLRAEDGDETVTASAVGGLFVAPPPRMEQEAPTYKSAPLSVATPATRSPMVIGLFVVAGACLLCLPVTGALLFPVFAQARLAARQSMTNARGRLLMTATMTYTVDHDGLFPPDMSSAQAAKPALAPYGNTKAVDQIFVSGNPNSNVWQGNDSLNAASLYAVPTPKLTLVFFDEKDWPGGKRVVGLADGSTAIIQGADVQAAGSDGLWVLSPVALEKSRKRD